MNKVNNITIEFWNGILNNNDTKGIKIKIGKHVKNQHEIIFKKRTSSTDISDVRYISIIPLLKSSLKKLLEVKIVVNIAVIQIIPGIILSNKFFSGPNTKGNIDIIKKKNTRGKNILFKFLKYKANSFFTNILIIFTFQGPYLNI